jgi:hypothetical protein
MLRRFCESFKWSLTYNEARMPTFLLYFNAILGVIDRGGCWRGLWYRFLLGTVG